MGNSLLAWSPKSCGKNTTCGFITLLSQWLSPQPTIINPCNISTVRATSHTKTLVSIGGICGQGIWLSEYHKAGPDSMPKNHDLEEVVYTRFWEWVSKSVYRVAQEPVSKLLYFLIAGGFSARHRIDKGFTTVRKALHYVYRRLYSFK